MTADWPYAEDGVKRDEFAESLRLPLISNPYPRWCYITAVVVNETETVPSWQGIRPTDDELRVAASFHEAYLAHWYRSSYLAKMMSDECTSPDSAGGGQP